MKRRFLLILALGVSFAPPVFALGESKDPAGGRHCGRTIQEDKILDESNLSQENKQVTHSVKSGTQKASDGR